MLIGIKQLLPVAVKFKQKEEINNFFKKISNILFFMEKENKSIARRNTSEENFLNELIKKDIAGYSQLGGILTEMYSLIP